MPKEALEVGPKSEVVKEYSTEAALLAAVEIWKTVRIDAALGDNTTKYKSFISQFHERFKIEGTGNEGNTGATTFFELAYLLVEGNDFTIYVKSDADKAAYEAAFLKLGADKKHPINSLGLI